MSGSETRRSIARSGEADKLASVGETEGGLARPLCRLLKTPGHPVVSRYRAEGGFVRREGEILRPRTVSLSADN